MRMFVSGVWQIAAIFMYVDLHEDVFEKVAHSQINMLWNVFTNVVCSYHMV